VPEAANEGLDGVTAVVVTHRRPRLAGDLVRSLIHDEGFRPQQVVVVVSGEGGLDDAGLEDSVRMVRLATNVGPGAGFREGLRRAFDGSVEWAYLCEDDVVLSGLPVPRVASLLEAVRRRSPTSMPVGAVVAYGRRFDRRGHASNVVPPAGGPRLVPVDVAAWGATLVHRAVVERGVLPDPEWYFGYEDFDFFCRVREAGLAVLVDAESARAVAATQTSRGREEAIAGARPTDGDESWRAYYVARNFFLLARAHGSVRWVGWHLAYSGRRLQLAGSGAERSAIVHGLIDGARGRRGAHARYGRDVG
jgi:hypothetical protein